MDSNTQTPTRNVTSVNAAAWLICTGNYPVEILPGPTVTFVFNDTGKEVSGLLAQWYHGPCPVDAGLFLAAQTQVRTLIRQHRTPLAKTAATGTPV